MSKALQTQVSPEDSLSDLLPDLLPEEGIWLLELSKVLMDVAIAISVVYFLPIVAIILCTMYGFSYMKNPRQTAIGVVPIIWGSNLLVYNIAEVATVIVYLSVRRLSSLLISSIRRKLCDSIQTSHA